MWRGFLFYKVNNYCFHPGRMHLRPGIQVYAYIWIPDIFSPARLRSGRLEHSRKADALKNSGMGLLIDTTKRFNYNTPIDSS